MFGDARLRGRFGRSRVQSGAAVFGLAAFFFTAYTTSTLSGIMSLPGQFAVGPSGAATYTIPLKLPPGTAGVVPNLSLVYNSQGRNGLLGMGWMLSGLPSIGRCPRTEAQDGVQGGVNFDSNDRFCLNGKRLVQVGASAGGSDIAIFRTEIEEFSNIISHSDLATSGPAWFEVHTRSGQVMEFGNTVDSQIQAQGKSAVRVWAVNKVSDSSGNYFTVAYNNDTTNGDFSPAQINYTGNDAAGLVASNSVQFSYETRTDVVARYQAGVMSQTAGRLSEIRVYTGATLVSDYRLTYQTSTSSGRSRLTSVQLCGAGGNCLPASSFGWSDTSQSFDVPQGWLSGGAFAPSTGWTDMNTLPRFFQDVNGDGLPDIVGLYNSCVYVSLNTGSSFQPAACWLGGGAFAPQTGWTDMNTLPRFFQDVNGDGLPDIVGLYNSCVYVSLNTGSSFQQAACWLAGGAFAPQTGWTDMNTLPRFFQDVNGDGLPDIIGLYNSCVYVSLNTGSSFQPAACWLAGGAFAPQTGWTDMNAMPRFLVDVTGDGLPDIVGIASNCLFVSASLGTAFGPPNCWLNGATSNGAFSAGWSDMKTKPIFLADVNGDGLADIVGIAPNCVFVSLSTGSSFNMPACWLDGAKYYGAYSAGWTDMNTMPRYLVDVNGDGLADIVGIAPNCTFVSVSSGTGFGGAPACWLGGGAFTSASGQWAGNDTTPRVLVDDLGTGRPGILAINNQGIFISPSGGSSIAPDLLVNITNGLAAVTSVTYTPATNQTVVSKAASGTTRFPILDLVSPLYVVARVDSSNGVGGAYSSAYSYFGGRIDTQGRGFLGFGQTSVRDLQTNLTNTTTYRQDFPYLGLVASTMRSFGAQTISQSANTYQFNGWLGATMVAPNSAPYQVLLKQNVASGADLDGSALPAVTTTNSQYDTFGNAQQVVVSTSDGLSKTTANTYNNDTFNWHLGQLTRSGVTGVAP